MSYMEQEKTLPKKPTRHSISVGKNKKTGVGDNLSDKSHFSEIIMNKCVEKAYFCENTTNDLFENPTEDYILG